MQRKVRANKPTEIEANRRDKMNTSKRIICKPIECTPILDEEDSKEIIKQVLTEPKSETIEKYKKHLDLFKKIQK